jgi:hypothetical protein
VSRGAKLALATSALEGALALVLLSKDLGLFALLAMPFIGMAWLPAAAMMFSELRQRADTRAIAAIAPVMCAVAGVVCLCISVAWILASFPVG